MADVRADHEEAAIAHAGDAAGVLGAEIHGDVLADITTGADFEPRRSAAILDRLRRRAERGERIDFGARADRSMAGHVHMGDERTSLADRNVRANHTIGT